MGISLLSSNYWEKLKKKEKSKQATYLRRERTPNKVAKLKNLPQF